MGANYTRQSTYADGDTISAADTNDEFNQLLAAFAASTGHTHDGTAGEGGPITALATNSVTFGTGSDTDVSVTFDANTNDGVLTWMEEEDYFQFSDDILMSTTEKIQFRDTAIYLNSSTDGQLDIVADTEVQIAATTIDVNGNLDVSGTIVGASTVQGTTITATTAFVPDASDGAALGTSSLEFSDLFLADAAVINLGADQDVTLTHVADTGVLLNSTNQLQFGDSGTYIHQSADGVLDLVSDTEIEINATTIDINGNVEVSGSLTGAGTVQGTTITATTAFVPDASDGAALGTSSLEFSDLFLADAAVINLGADQDVTLTHVADTGILLNSTRQLQFGDSGTYIHQSADGVLDLVSDTEIEINATTIDINGNVDISGTSTLTGNVTLGGQLIMPDVTSGKILVADNTSYQEVAVSGDATIASNGALTIADNAISLAKLAGIARGKLIVGDSSGDPSVIGPGTSGQVLLSDGTDIAFGAAPAASGAATGITSILNASLVVGRDADNQIKFGTDNEITFRVSAGDNVVFKASGEIEATSLDISNDLFLADGRAIQFGNDQEITLTHVADSGLTLKHDASGDDKFPTLTLAAGDNDIAANDKLGVLNFIAPDEGAGTDAILVAAGIEAVSEGDFSASSNATKLSFKTAASAAAAETASLSSAGVFTATSFAGDGSNLTGIAPFPSGTSMLFQQSSAPTGWTKQSTHDDKALRIVTGTVGTGGSVAFSTALATPSLSGSTGSTTLATSQIPSHSHTISTERIHEVGTEHVSTSQNGTHGSKSTNAAGGGGSHNHSMSGTATINVNYVDFIIANKD